MNRPVRSSSLPALWAALFLILAGMAGPVRADEAPGASGPDTLLAKGQAALEAITKAGGATAGTQWFALCAGETKHLGTARLDVERLSGDGEAGYRVRFEMDLALGAAFSVRVTHDQRLGSDLNLLSFTATTLQREGDETKVDWTARGRRDGDRWRIEIESRAEGEPVKTLLEAPASPLTISETGIMLLVRLLPRGGEDAWAFRLFRSQDLGDYAGRGDGGEGPVEADLEQRAEVRAAAPAPLVHRGTTVEATRFTLVHADSWLGEMLYDVGSDGRLLVFGKRGEAALAHEGSAEQARQPLRAAPPIDPESPRGRLRTLLRYQAGEGDAKDVDAVTDWEALRAAPPLRGTEPGALDVATLRARVLEGLRQESSRLPVGVIQDLLEILEERSEGDVVVVTAGGSRELTWRFARKDGRWWIVGMPPLD